MRDVLEKGDLYFRTGDLLRQDPDGYVCTECRLLSLVVGDSSTDKVMCV